MEKDGCECEGQSYLEGIRQHHQLCHLYYKFVRGEYYPWELPPTVPKNAVEIVRHRRKMYPEYDNDGKPIVKYYWYCRMPNGSTRFIHESDTYREMYIPPF